MQLSLPLEVEPIRPMPIIDVYECPEPGRRTSVWVVTASQRVTVEDWAPGNAFPSYRTMRPLDR